KEMPSLDKLKAELAGDDFDLVALSIDRTGLEKPRKFLEEIGVKHLELFNNSSGRLASSLKAFGMPTTLLLNRKGQELGRLVGPAEW
ncbi:MAG: TlpA family protein disulfide reductase, partial [Desulfuromonadales bacterium]|nr:TlpA family protein disulfide reductase [Desulfuromonadales bacterium]